MSSEESETEVFDAPSIAEDYERAPWRKVRTAEAEEIDDELFMDGNYIPADVDTWCQCGKCTAWPERLMNVCCQDHEIWKTRNYDGNGQEIKCITQLESVGDLLKAGPLRVMYNNYKTYHAPRYTDAESLVPTAVLTQEEINRRINAQRRLCAYRSLIFWAYPDIRKKQRRALPSCVYGMIRAVFPSHEDEELWADLQHTVYVDVPEEDD